MTLARAITWEWDLHSDQLSFWGDLPTLFGVDWRTPEDVWHAIDPKDLRELAQAREQALLDRGSYQVQVRAHRDDGTPFGLDILGKVICDDAGATRMVHGVFREVPMPAQEGLPGLVHDLSRETVSAPTAAFGD